MSARGAKVLVPLADLDSVEGLLDIARALAVGPAGRVTLLHVVEVAEESSLSVGALAARRARQELERLQVEGIKIRSVVRVSREAWRGVVEAVEEEEVDLLILRWRGESEAGKVFGTTIDEMLRDPPCDVVMAKLPSESVALSDCRRILLPARGGGPHIKLALEVTRALVERCGAEITLLHAVPEGAADEGAFESLSSVLWGLRGVTRRITARGEVADAILQEARHHQAIVMGAAAGLPVPPLVGPIAEEATRKADKLVLVVKAKEEGHPRPRLPVVRPMSEVVGKWFAENAFHSHEFADLKRLVEIKEEQGVTISLGLPALNEAKTVGRIIETINRELMERYPLLDEMVLIDSDSTDETVEIAKGLGIPVYLHREILPQYGSYRGKGEALWKSLHVLKGDIIVWIDTDIVNIHPRFVYGLIGPLLRERNIVYVKGFYRRPLALGKEILAAGGGRVTELVARPLINLFYPELSGMVQPLAGEYAGRREALESVPFFTGYGVEMGLLIDILERYGLQAIAQVDLEERIHRHQTLVSLSKMAFAIIQVFIERLEARHRLRLLEEINRSMKLIRYEPGRFSLDEQRIGDRERPPMMSAPETLPLHKCAPN